MNVLYLSSLLPRDLFDALLKVDKSSYVVAPQKFHQILVDGMVQNGHSVKAISYLPESLPYQANLEEEGVEYFFTKYHSTPGIKHLQISLSTFSIIRSLIRNGFKPDVIICDTLKVSLCLGALLSKYLMQTRVTGIVTDIMGVFVHKDTNMIRNAATIISKKYITKFDNYILLTKQMNEVVNPYHKPFIVMEGVCQQSLNSYKKNPEDQSSSPSNIRNLFYAGGRPSKDGVDLLIEAFKQIENDNIRLNIFGDMPGHIVGIDPIDSRIVYHGVVNNAQIIEEERNSYLLINPRPTGETYTLYSFPSKVMEYMSTGVAMVTTKLAGIPDEYFNHSYTFETCSIECYRDTLKRILELPEQEVFEKGNSARKFVTEQKNNLIQTERILDFTTNSI